MCFKVAMASTSRKFTCKNDPDLFCFVCGHFILKTTGRKITDEIKYEYLQYFGFALVNEDKPWTPSLICSNCRLILNKWSSGEETYFSFGIPMIWSEALDHSDCYFCAFTAVVGINKKKRKSLNYPDVTTAKKPVPYSECNLPKPKPGNHKRNKP